MNNFEDYYNTTLISIEFVRMFEFVKASYASPSLIVLLDCLHDSW